jgi:hypothetical protein
MQPFRVSLAIVAFLTCSGMAGTAYAQQQPAARPKPVPRTIILDPNFNRAPPVPHDRQYVGPGPSLSPPMERITPVAPLAQPPIR